MSETNLPEKKELPIQDIGYLKPNIPELDKDTIIAIVVPIVVVTILIIIYLLNLIFNMDEETAKTSMMFHFLENRFSINISDKNTIANLKKIFMKNTTIFLFILISSIIIYFVSTDKDALTNKMYIYGFAILLPLFVGIYFSTKLFADGDTVSPYRLAILSVVLFLIAIVGYFYSKASGTSLVIMNYILFILIFFIIIGGLAIFYFVFSNYLSKQTGTLGFIINLIFYIPCLFADFIGYLKQQLNITPSTTFILLIIEIILILLYFFIPKITSAIVSNNSTVIMNDPVFLNQENVIANSTYFIVNENNPHKNGDMDNTIVYRNSNYCISFWTYVNPGSKSKKSYINESNIFNYANGKPKVTYVNDSKEHNNKYIIYFTNRTDEPEENRRYEISLPMQRWNYFVFNYHNNKCDLFVNGILERTFIFNTNSVPLNGNEMDNIIVGSNNSNGIYGAICNVCYYKTILTETEITRIYNLLQYKNPPVIGKQNNKDQ